MHLHWFQIRHITVSKILILFLDPSHNFPKVKKKCKKAIPNRNFSERANQN